MNRTILILGLLIGAGIGANVGLAVNNRFRELQRDIAGMRGYVWAAPCICSEASR